MPWFGGGKEEENFAMKQNPFSSVTSQPHFALRRGGIIKNLLGEVLMVCGDPRLVIIQQGLQNSYCASSCPKPRWICVCSYFCILILISLSPQQSGTAFLKG